MYDTTLFKAEVVGDAMVVTPARNMGEFEMADSMKPAFESLVEMTSGRNVVLNLSDTDYFGSSTIGLFLRFVRHVHSQGRKIAFCSLSPNEQDIVDITHTNQLLDVKDSLADAIEFVST